MPGYLAYVAGLAQPGEPARRWRMTVGALLFVSGFTLLFVACIGLDLPFTLFAFGFGWVTDALAFVRRHMLIVSRTGGVFLVVIGALLLTGQWVYVIN